MTSKKCLIMNLKVGGRGSQANNRNAAHQQPNNNYQTKRQVPNNNNNNNSSNHNNNNNNAFSPLLPSVTKYDMAAPTSVHAPPPPPPSFYHPQPQSTAAAAAGFYFPGLFNTQSNFNIHNLLQPSMPSPLSIKQQHQDDCCDDDRNKMMIDVVDDCKDQDDSGADDDDEDKYENVIDVVNVVKKECEEGGDENVNGETDAAVKRLLETVNVSAVTKQLMMANAAAAAAAAAAALHHQQHQPSPSCGSSGSCPSVMSDSPPYHQHNNHHHHHNNNNHHHRSEGLAAKLEDSIGMVSGGCKNLSINNNNNGYDAGSDCYTDDEHRPCTTEEEDSVDQDGRKIRVRSQIADDQLAVLKECYAANPRPKREELCRIADRIGFSVRVVQVWFQNNRARDRREGRLVHMPYSPAPTSMLAVSVSATTTATNPEQPLDLSTKRNRRSGKDDYDECSGAVNLSLNVVQYWAAAAAANSRDDCSSSPPAYLPSRRTPQLSGAYPPPSPVYVAPPPPSSRHPASHSPIPAVTLRHHGSLSPASEKRLWKRVSIFI